MQPRLTVLTLGVGDLARAGARIVTPAARTFHGGRAGDLADPDGHRWDPAT